MRRRAHERIVGVDYARLLSQFRHAKGFSKKAYLDGAAEKDIGLYFLNVEVNLQNGHFNLFDSQGIPIRGSMLSPKYQITTICAYALANWNSCCLTKYNDKLTIFMRTVRFLIGCQSQNGGFYHHYPSGCGIKLPWVSGMPQDESLSVFARDDQLTGESRWKRRHQVRKVTF